MRLSVLAVLVVAAAVASTAGAATQPVVPTFTQQQIAKRVPRLAYVPARIPTGYRYFRWAVGGSALRIWFRNRAKHDVVFVAALRKTPCAAGKEKTFQMGGNKVYWSHTANEQQAWRCVDGVQLVAATSQPPTRFADVGLGRVAASGHRIR
jgi:hypothetical protein